MTKAYTEPWAPFVAWKRQFFKKNGDPEQNGFGCDKDWFDEVQTRHKLLRQQLKGTKKHIIITPRTELNPEKTQPFKDMMVAIKRDLPNLLTDPEFGVQPSQFVNKQI